MIVQGTLEKTVKRTLERILTTSKWCLAAMNKDAKDKLGCDTFQGVVVADCRLIKESVPDIKESRLVDMVSAEILEKFIQFANKITSFAQDC